MARLTKQQIAEAAEVQLKAEQQAELKRLRAAKTAATKAANKEARAKIDAPVDTVIGRQEFSASAEDAARQAKISAAWDTLMDQVGGIELPGWKRCLAGCILSIAAAAGVGYIVGTVAGLLIVGSMAVTGAVWLAYAIMALSIVLSCWAGGKIAQVVFGYIVEARVDDHYAAAKRRVSGWFKRDAIEQFSGAYQA